jgi:hypothetical protein
MNGKNPCRLSYHKKPVAITKGRKDNEITPTKKRKVEMLQPKESPSKLKKFSTHIFSRIRDIALKRKTVEEPKIKPTFENVTEFPISDLLIVAQMLEKIYKDLSDGYKVSKEEAEVTDGIAMRNLVGFGGATYGEVHYRSVPAVIKLLQIEKEDIFYDLGSGIGRCVIQIAAQTMCKKVIGIESAESRCKISEDALRRFNNLRQLHISPVAGSTPHNVQPQIEFWHQNILNCDLSDASKVFWNNVCFPLDVSEKILTKLMRLRPGTRLLCVRQLCSDRHGAVCVLRNQPCVHFRVVLQSKLECTWTKECPAYVYERI